MSFFHQISSWAVVPYLNMLLFLSCRKVNSHKQEVSRYASIILSHMHHVFHFTDKRDHPDDESGIGPSISTDTESEVNCYFLTVVLSLIKFAFI